MTAINLFIQDSKPCYFTASVGHICILLVTISRFIFFFPKVSFLIKTKHLLPPYSLQFTLLQEAVEPEFCNGAEVANIATSQIVIYEAYQQSQQRTQILE